VPKAKKPKLTEIWYDWKESPSVEDLQKALRPFGVFVADDPIFEGQDSHGFLFSDLKLTKAELKQRKKEHDEL